MADRRDEILARSGDIIRSARQQLQCLGLNPRELVAQFLNGAAQHAVKHGIGLERLEADVSSAFEFATELRALALECSQPPAGTGREEG